MLTRPLDLTALVLTAAACSVTSRVSPDQYEPGNSPPRIVVREKSGTFYVLDHPTVTGDRLRGTDAVTTDTVSLPLSRVDEVLVTRKSPVRTVMLVGTITAAAMVMVLRGRGGRGDSCKLIDDHEDVVGKGTQCDPNVLSSARD